VGLIELLIVVLVVLWLLGYFGRGRFARRGPELPATPPFGGSWIHFLIIVALILVILRLLKII
jgi:hypothetical protein